MLSEIRAALETALATITPPIDTVHENTSYNPVTGTPYQRVWFIWAQPNNQEFGRNYQEQGFMQVDLNYPQSNGPAGIDSRIQLIRDKFARGQSFTNGGVIVTIHDTPNVLTSYNDGDRFIRPVNIRFYANINL